MANSCITKYQLICKNEASARSLEQFLKDVTDSAQCLAETCELAGVAEKDLEWISLRGWIENVERDEIVVTFVTDTDWQPTWFAVRLILEQHLGKNLHEKLDDLWFDVSEPGWEIYLYGSIKDKAKLEELEEISS
jgi:hypothetical protein